VADPRSILRRQLYVKPKGPKPEAERSDGVLGQRQQAMGLRECCKLLYGICGGASATTRFLAFKIYFI